VIESKNDVKALADELVVDE